MRWRPGSSNLIRKPKLDSTLLDATIEQIRELFSFELVEVKETARDEGEHPQVTVEASTPKSTVA
jgi:hypothetical protein